MTSDTLFPVPPVTAAPGPDPVTPEVMTAREVKDALRRRHPAGSGQMPGEWTCTEEWENIDFLAWSAWRGAKRVGYEVKVSRSDYRRELLRPHKRTAALAICHEFYFAVPKGLLTKAEFAYEESLWDDGDFKRETCPANCTKRRDTYGANQRYAPRRGTVARLKVPVPVVLSSGSSWWERENNFTDEQRQRYRDSEIEHGLRTNGWTHVACGTCEGKGYVKGSRVEREAPTLWIPRDVGLVEITGAGCRVVRKAPRNQPRDLTAQEVGQLVRWVSQRPDPRHHEEAA